MASVSLATKRNVDLHLLLALCVFACDPAGYDECHRLGAFNIQRFDGLFGKEQDIACEVVGLRKIDSDMVL